MIRHRVTAAMMVVFLLVFTACASSVRINSRPQGAQVFIDGISIGSTPTTYTDSAILFTNRSVELRLDGYEVHRAVIRRDAQINVLALIGGLCICLPLLLWMFDYPAEVSYELRPVYGDTEAPEIIKEEEDLNLAMSQ